MPSLRPRKTSHDPAGRRNPVRLVFLASAWSIGSIAHGTVAGAVICASARRLTPPVVSGLDSMLPAQLVGVTALSTDEAGLAF